MALSTPSAKISQPIKLTLELDFASSLIFSPSPIPISKILGVLILLNNVFLVRQDILYIVRVLKKTFLSFFQNIYFLIRTYKKLNRKIKKSKTITEFSVEEQIDWFLVIGCW